MPKLCSALPTEHVFLSFRSLEPDLVDDGACSTEHLNNVFVFLERKLLRAITFLLKKRIALDKRTIVEVEIRKLDSYDVFGLIHLDAEASDLVVAAGYRLQDEIVINGLLEVSRMDSYVSDSQLGYPAKSHWDEVRIVWSCGWFHQMLVREELARIIYTHFDQSDRLVSLLVPI